MSCFIGEVVRWTDGNDFALIKPILVLDEGHVRGISPREIELEFLETGLATWEQPARRCRVGRKVLFKLALPASTNRKLGRHRIDPIEPRIVLSESLTMNSRTIPVFKKVQWMATCLTLSGAHELAQDLRVYLKNEPNLFDYFGPFELQNSVFVPPSNLKKFKRYKVDHKGLTTVFIEELGIEIIKPLLELEKVGEEIIPPSTAPEQFTPTTPQPDLIGPSTGVEAPGLDTSVQSRTWADNHKPPHLIQPVNPNLAIAIKKLEKLLPLNSLKVDLDVLHHFLIEAKEFTEEERSLLVDALLEGASFGKDIQHLLPLLHEHAGFADYFEAELKAFKENEERKIRSELERRIEADMQVLVAEREQLRAEQEAMTHARISFIAEMEGLQKSPVGPEGPVGDRQDTQGHSLHHDSEEKAAESRTPLAQVDSNHGWPRKMATPNGRPIISKEALEILLNHVPLSRLQAAWSVGRIPLVCGPRSLRLLKRYADTMCGGLFRWASIDPLLTRARDLLGTFVDGWFQPHHSGIASLLAQSFDNKFLGVVVFEGANRAPLELVLEPFLHSRESGIPLFSSEAFRPEDPWAVLGQAPWPTHLLMGCTLTTGVAKQPISPSLWDRLFIIDDSAWPKSDRSPDLSYLSADQFGALAISGSCPKAADTLDQFCDEVKEAKWGRPGAVKLIRHLEGLEVPDAIQDALVLLLGPAAMCAGSDPESWASALEAQDRLRVENLRPFL